jgi:transposase
VAIGNQLRRSIVQAVQTHQVSQTRLGQMLGVSVSSIKRIWQRWRQTGNSQLLAHAGGQRPRLTDQQREQVRQYVLADTDATLREVQRWLAATHHLRLSLPALSRLLTKLNLPRKKNHSTPRNATHQLTNKSVPSGAGKSAGSIRPASSSSTKAA